MPRQREFDPKDVLRAAIDLFWEKGYKSSSVDEIVKRSGVAKYGIYGSLGGKRDMFWKALNQYAIDRQNDLQLPLRRPSASLEEIFEFFNGIAESTTKDIKTCGCLVVKVGIEMGPHDKEVREFVKQFFRDIAYLFENCLNRARSQSKLKASLEIPAAANFLATELRAVLMLAGSGHSKADLKDHLDFALQSIC